MSLTIRTGLSVKHDDEFYSSAQCCTSSCCNPLIPRTVLGWRYVWNDSFQGTGTLAAKVPTCSRHFRQTKRLSYRFSLLVKSLMINDARAISILSTGKSTTTTAITAMPMKTPTTAAKVFAPGASVGVISVVSGPLVAETERRKGKGTLSRNRVAFHRRDLKKYGETQMFQYAIICTNAVFDRRVPVPRCSTHGHYAENS